jgi:phospholipid/cholesterol/gamma-HCH transport system substrate-binding protein
MKFRIRYADQVVGLFVLLAGVGAAAVLILAGVNQRWFARDYAFVSRFPSANGLSIGMPITLKGFEIGRTRSISLNFDNTVDLDFVVFDTYYDKVRPHSVLELASNPLGLAGGLQFHPGRNELEPIAEGVFIPSLASAAGQELVSRGAVDRAAQNNQINDILNSVGSMVAGLDAAIAGDSSGPLGRTFVQLANVVGQVENVLSSVDTAVAQIQQVALNLTAAADNIAVTTAEFRDPTGLVPRLLDPQGSVATFLDDDNLLFGRVDTALVHINEIIDQLGEVANFVSDQTPQLTGLIEEGRNTLSVGQDVLEGLANNPLLRGGITREVAQPTTVQGFRDEDF